VAINTYFLRDGEHGGDGAQAGLIASRLAAFVEAAETSLHLAVYDFRLSSAQLSDPVINALKNRAAGGVEVKILYDAGKPQNNAVRAAAFFAENGADPAPQGTGDFLNRAFGGTSIELKAISSKKLMHQKYVLRDGQTSAASVWTGSTNFTDDAWTLQETNIVVIDSPELSALYENDFRDIWIRGDIQGSGAADSAAVAVGNTSVGIEFSPSNGARADRLIADCIAAATRRVKLATMILSSRAITAALDDVIAESRVRVDGIYDATQMEEVCRNWTANGRQDLVDSFNQIAAAFASKRSEPYSPSAKHNFMHNKVAVCDDVVVTGSFNFSKSATDNAENVLFVRNREIADSYAAYIDALISEYHP
jgi:phosphatidylserine/phosphatidylglycerophosphate/cardiolipin synthase-like enzyme